MRPEGARQRPPRDGLQHRRFHLQVSPLVEVPADLADDGAALDENLADPGVHNEVDVALAEPGFHVGQPVPLFRQGLEVLGQVVHLGGEQRQFARASAEDGSLRPDDVAQVEQPEELEHFFPHRVATDVHLHAPLAVGEVQEPGLAVRAQRQDAAADPGRLFPVLERGGIQGVEGRAQLPKGVGVVEPARIGVVTQALELGQLEAALFEEISLVVHGRPAPWCVVGS